MYEGVNDEYVNISEGKYKDYYYKYGYDTSFRVKREKYAKTAGKLCVKTDRNTGELNKTKYFSPALRDIAPYVNVHAHTA